LVDLENSAARWTATRWQRDLFPPEYREDFVVLHPGVDAGWFNRRADSGRLRSRLAELSLPKDARLATFVARRLDRLRGFDRFVALANRLMRERSDVVCVAVGGGPVERGLDVEFFGRDYAAHVLNQTPPHDAARLRLTGALAPDAVADLLAASDLHVYPSRAYSVSRSLLEAMAAGCVVLAWDEAPVREFVEHGRTALLADPADADAAARLALAALADPAAHRPLGEAAAAEVRERFDRDATLPRLAAWFDRLASRN
jgi:glycosyltransferase involved in cell wall biosynthesis